MIPHKKLTKPELKKFYLYKIVLRFIWPLTPIFMEVAINALLGKQQVFPNKSLLVLTFIIPASYLVDYKDKLTLTLVNLLCILSAIPFFCSIITQSSLVMWTGFAVLCSYIITFVLVDIVSYYKQKVSLVGG